MNASRHERRARITAIALLVGLGAGSSPSAQRQPASAAAGWKAGTAKVRITPEQPMRMAGYAGRRGPARGTIHDLWAKALWLEDAAGERALLITLDVTGVDRRFSLRVRDRLKEAHGLERRQIALCSSHTHSGPVTSDRFTWVFGLDEREHGQRLHYLAALEENIVAVVAEALGRLAPCRLRAGTGAAGFAFNRRDNREDAVEALRAKNELRGPSDPDVPVLAVESPGGELRAVAFGYACHCTTLGPENLEWCGDYAGFAQARLEDAHPDATALFWAGCGGDQNPGPRRTLQHAESHGRALADAVERVLGGSMTELASALATSYREIELPFAAVPTRAELEKEAATSTDRGKRARFLLAQLARGHELGPTYPYPVQVWRLGADRLFVTLGGEAVVDYALRIKREHGAARTWVGSYANDVMAYIPSLRVLQEGGYEGRTSMMVYGLPAPWGPQIEPLILDAVREGVERVGAPVRGRPLAADAAIDFEDTRGKLDPTRWYVSGGMDATRLRTGARRHRGAWSLSTAGDPDYPTRIANVHDSSIDANTSVAWGPFFTLRDELPDGAELRCHVAGGSKPWSDSRTAGPTGVALWDVAAADFARDRLGAVLYAACERNGFDFEPASIPLRDLAGKTLGLAVVDRAAQSWAWTSVDDVEITRDCHEFSERLHHRVTVAFDFDDDEGLAGWTGDRGAFGLRGAGAAPTTALFVDRRVGARGGARSFAEDVGYLSSAAGAPTGTIRSPDFTLDGHMLEFYLAGDGGEETAFELVSADGRVLARAAPAPGGFAYELWRIQPAWRGTTAHVRLLDRSATGRIDVDAIRVVEFDVEVDEPAPDEGRDGDAPAPAPRAAAATATAGEPAVALVPRVVDNRSGGKTVIHPAITYSFSTAQLNGELRPLLPKPGVVRCRHKPTGFNVLPEIPQHALLMPEWLLRPGNGRQGLFWAPLRAVPRVEVDGGSIVFHVAAAQTRDWNADFTFRYTPERDWIDFECTIVPHVAIEDFELFVASYVTEDMESTWVSAAGADGETFRRIDCRKTVPWGSVYTVARDAEARSHLEDGRWKLPPKEAGTDLWQDYHFARPILIALDEETGLAAVTLVDPAVCSLLAGQHHRVETAHDFALDADLVPERPFVGRARVVIRKIGRFPEAKRAIDAMWQDFAASLD